MGNELRPYNDSVQDVADHLGVHPQTVYRWLRDVENGIPHRKVGRVIRFNLAEVDAWAASESVPAASAN